MMKRKHHIGRLRICAAAILNKAFPQLDVRPEHIKPASGVWRSCSYYDVYRWELYTRTKSGCNVVCGCWETLTEFVREAAKHGCHCSDDEIYGGPETDRFKTPWWAKP